MKRKRTIPSEVDVYQCAFAEPDFDNFCGEWNVWCHSSDRGCNTCDCGRYVFAQQFCPYFRRGKLRGKWEPGSLELECADEYKRNLEKKKVDAIREIQRLTKFVAAVGGPPLGGDRLGQMKAMSGESASPVPEGK